MNQVKIFDCGRISDLEKKINSFLETKGSETTFELVDIKFNSYPYGDDQTDYHSAMIIYKL